MQEQVEWVKRLNRFKRYYFGGNINSVFIFVQLHTFFELFMIILAS